MMRSLATHLVFLGNVLLAIGSGRPAVAAEADPAAAALARLRAASAIKVRGSFDHGAARTLLFSVPASGATPVERANAFLRDYGDLLRLRSQHLALQVARVVPGEPGEPDRVRFTETYRGVPVYGSELDVELTSDRVLALGGAWLKEREPVDLRVKLDGAAAVGVAGQALGLKEVALLADTRLVVLDQGLFGKLRAPRPRLAWQVTAAASPSESLFVDASSGKILMRVPLDLESGLDLSSVDDIGPDTPAGVCFEPFCYDVLVATESFFDTRYSGVQDAVRSYYYSHELHDFWADRFGRDSYDDDGGKIEIVFDAGIEAVATTQLWNDHMLFQPYQVDRDVLGHEFTHLVVRETSDLAPCYQSAALNEGYADIMGAAFDQAEDDVFDWLLRDEPVTSMVAAGSFPDFDMADPSKAGGSSCGPCASVPDSWDAYLEPVDGPTQHAHENAGILMKAHFLMSEGGVHPVTGAEVHAIGNTKMNDLAYRTLRGLPSNATFRDAASWSLHYATYWSMNNLKGFTPTHVCRVEQAFAATGIYVDSGSDCSGIATPSDKDGDGAPDASDNCVGVANPSQLDSDDDEQGDDCDANDDGDAFPDSSDKCPGQPSTYNGPCGDQDEDGVLDSEDNCPYGHNPGQADSNRDGIGDACDSDPDLDGVWTMAGDNCPFDYNPYQANHDGDPWGDACDLCPYNTDPQPWMSSPITGRAIQPDGDGDGVPDACDDSVRIDGGPAAGSGLQADGKPHSIDLRGATAGRFQRVAVQLCKGRCADTIEQRYRAAVSFGSLDPRLHPLVVDQDGKAVAKPRPDPKTGASVARFSPRPGKSYAIRIQFGEDVEPGASFAMQTTIALEPKVP